MTIRAATVFLALLVSPVAAQDSQEIPEVPKDSRLITANGCAKNGIFVVSPRREDQPGTLEVEPGSRFRLKGDRTILRAIRAREHALMRVTGLVREVDLINSGIGVARGQVRIKAVPHVPQQAIQDPAHNPLATQPVVLDVQSWQQIPGNCR